ncbi:hypothetical protein JCM16303_005535 [Sporobolomyces ruberrimus]
MYLEQLKQERKQLRRELEQLKAERAVKAERDDGTGSQASMDSLEPLLDIPTASIMERSEVMQEFLRVKLRLDTLEARLPAQIDISHDQERC